MKPVIGRSTGKVDIYAGNWSELGGCRVRMWIEDTKEGGREQSTGVRRYSSRRQGLVESMYKILKATFRRAQIFIDRRNINT